MQGKWEAADRIIEKMKTGDFGGRGYQWKPGVGGVGLRITILPPTHIAQFKTARNAGKAGGGGYTLAPLHFAAKEVSLYFILF
jgi:hypothetical protein